MPKSAYSREPAATRHGLTFNAWVRIATSRGHPSAGTAAAPADASRPASVHVRRRRTIEPVPSSRAAMPNMVILDGSGIAVVPTTAWNVPVVSA